MEFPLVAIGVIVFARVLDTTALRALDADARARIDAALLQARVLNLGAIVVALVAGAVAYAAAPDVPVQVVVLGILAASFLTQALLGGVRLVKAGTEGRYTTVFVVSRLVSAGAVALLLTT